MMYFTMEEIHLYTNDKNNLRLTHNRNCNILDNCYILKLNIISNLITTNAVSYMQNL